MTRPARSVRHARTRLFLEGLEERLTPRVTIVNAPMLVPEGSMISLQGQVFTPPDAAEEGVFFNEDEVQFFWRVTREGMVIADGQGPAFTFTPDDNGQYLVDLRGIVYGEVPLEGETRAINVFNVPPTAVITGDSSGTIGLPVVVSGTFTDPGTADTHLLAWEVKRDGATIAEGTGTTFQFVPTTGGNYELTFKVTDDDQGVGNVTMTVQVPGLVVNPPAPPTPTNPPSSSDSLNLLPFPAVDSLPDPLPPSGVFYPSDQAALILPFRLLQGGIPGRIDGGGAGLASDSSLPLLAFGALTASEVGSLGLGAEAARTANLIPADLLPADTTGRIDSGSGNNQNLRQDHVKNRILQSVASLTVEDDSVAIFEAAAAGSPLLPEKVVTSPAPGVSAVVPVASEPAPVLFNREPDQDSHHPQTLLGWVARATFVFASLLAGVRGDRWRSFVSSLSR